MKTRTAKVIDFVLFGTLALLVLGQLVQCARSERWYAPEYDYERIERK